GSCRIPALWSQSSLQPYSRLSIARCPRWAGFSSAAPGVRKAFGTAMGSRWAKQSGEKVKNQPNGINELQNTFGLEPEGQQHARRKGAHQTNSTLAARKAHIAAFRAWLAPSATDPGRASLVEDAIALET